MDDESVVLVTVDRDAEDLLNNCKHYKIMVRVAAALLRSDHPHQASCARSTLNRPLASRLLARAPARRASTRRTRSCA